MDDQRNPRHTVTIAGLPHVIDIGLVQNARGHAQRLLDFWVLGIAVAGRFRLEIGDEQVAVGAGDYYLLPPRLPHRGLDSTPFDTLFFHFTLPKDCERGLLLELPLSGECSPVLNYLALFRFLEANFRSGLLSGDELGVQLWAIFGQLCVMQRERVLLQADPKRVLASEILEFLRANYSGQLTSSAIASRMGYSYPYLERVFRSSFGCSIHQELLRIRLQVAAHALQMGKPIKDVAKEVGFSDYYYFLKVFKRAKGMSPGAFQASHRTPPG